MGVWVFLITVTAMMLSGIHPAKAQQNSRYPLVGFLATGLPPSRAAPLNENLKAFQEGLRELGYIEGKNLFIEYRYVKGQRGPSRKFAEELVRRKANVIVATSTPAIVATRQVTSKVPIGLRPTDWRENLRN